MIQVQIVVAGGMGDLALSMFPELVGERRRDSQLIVADQAAAARLLAQLAAAGIEVLQVVEQAHQPASTTRTG